MLYIQLNQPGGKVNVKPRYGNFIGGQWLTPVNGQYFENLSPVNDKIFCESHSFR